MYRRNKRLEILEELCKDTEFDDLHFHGGKVKQRRITVSSVFALHVARIQFDIVHRPLELPKPL
jgi:hypothetical protein